MKSPIFRLITLSLIAIVTALTASAGDYSYYKNISVTVNNPTPARGTVYLTPGLGDKNSSRVAVRNSKAASTVEGCFSTSSSKDYSFTVNCWVFPEKGYILRCICTQKAYNANDYLSQGFMMDKNQLLYSLPLAVDNDTVNNCSRQGSDYDQSTFRPAVTRKYYAIFEPAKQSTIRTTRRGELETKIKNSTYGEHVNELVISGPLNDDDLMYLGDLPSLTRVDLSKASFTSIPDMCFFTARQIVSIILPRTVTTIGYNAFGYCTGLLPVNIPPSAKFESNIREECTVWNYLQPEKSSDDDDDDDAYSGYLNLLDSLL